MTEDFISDPYKNWIRFDFAAPWERGRTSIYNHVLVGKDGEDFGVLPDHDLFLLDEGVSLSGSLHDDFLENPDEDTKTVLKALRHAIARPSPERIASLYNALVETRALVIGDDVFENLSDLEDIEVDCLIALLYWIVRNAPDREPVKFALLGLSQYTNPSPHDLLVTFGKHAEFTLLACVGLLKIYDKDKARKNIFDLAKDTKGSARAEAIPVLIQVMDSEIQHWLVRDGILKSPPYDYLALFAAEAGQLLQQLTAKNAMQDSALLDGTAAILAAWSTAHAEDGINNYEHSQSVASIWLKYVMPLPQTPIRLRGALAIMYHAQRAYEDGVPDWPAADAKKIEANAGMYLFSSRQFVKHLLENGTEEDLQVAVDVAITIGEDFWPGLFAKQTKDSTANLWSYLSCKRTQIVLKRCSVWPLSNCPWPRSHLAQHNTWGLGQNGI